MSQSTTFAISPIESSPVAHRIHNDEEAILAPTTAPRVIQLRRETTDRDIITPQSLSGHFTGNVSGLGLPPLQA